ncbi:MAG: hypothetical protein LC808_06995 [Actinobacteria bacterium]|nr:hypothetical protein [Actinomycetota bacterium]
MSRRVPGPGPEPHDCSVGDAALAIHGGRPYKVVVLRRRWLRRGRRQRGGLNSEVCHLQQSPRRCDTAGDTLARLLGERTDNRADSATRSRSKHGQPAEHSPQAGGRP